MVAALLGEQFVVVGLVASGLIVALVFALARRTARPLGVMTALSLAATGWVLVLTLYPIGPVGRSSWASCLEALSQPFLSLTGPEAVANVLLFLVPACLWTLATGRPFVVILGLVAGSWGIEMVQASGIGHSCTGNDLAHNSLGALMGVTLAVLVLRLAHGCQRRG